MTRQRTQMLDESCATIGRDPGGITRSFLVGITADTPFASLGSFHDFVGRLHEIGITEFIFYYEYPAIPFPESGKNALHRGCLIGLVRRSSHSDR